MIACADWWVLGCAWLGLAVLIVGVIAFEAPRRAARRAQERGETLD